MRIPGFSLRTGERVDAITPDIYWSYDLLAYKGTLAAVCRTKQDCADLVHWFGDEDFCPVHPILMCVPGAWGSLAGMGLASAAELRDEAVARWELQEVKLRLGILFDFDTAREKAGLMRREEVDAKAKEALMDYIRHKRANPITDPVRQFHYDLPGNRTLHKVAADQSWKES